MVEILKQDEYVPMPVEKQVLVILCANEGLLDDLPTASLKRFESEYAAFMDKEYPDLVRDLRQKQKLDDELTKKLRTAAEKFVGQFKAALGS
jgi:F-type H+-transporting ATPase subunit alpha